MQKTEHAALALAAKRLRIAERLLGLALQNLPDFTDGRYDWMSDEIEWWLRGPTTIKDLKAEARRRSGG